MNGTFSTALLRSIGLALLGILGAGWSVYAQSGDWRTAVTAALAAATAIIGGRGLLEGVYDARRQANGDIKPSDVQSIGSGKP